MNGEWACAVVFCNKLRVRWEGRWSGEKRVERRGRGRERRGEKWRGEGKEGVRLLP